MTSPAGEHVFQSPGERWQLWVLALVAAIGITLGLILRSIAIGLFFGHFCGWSRSSLPCYGDELS